MCLHRATPPTPGRRTAAYSSPRSADILLGAERSLIPRSLAENGRDRIGGSYPRPVAISHWALIRSGLKACFSDDPCSAFHLAITRRRVHIPIITSRLNKRSSRTTSMAYVLAGVRRECLLLTSTPGLIGGGTVSLDYRPSSILYLRQLPARLSRLPS